MRAAPPFLLLTLLLAGCASSPGPTAGPADETIVVTQPGDYSKDNGTSVDAPHLHDYWGGQDRIPVLDERVQAIVGMSGANQVVARLVPKGAVVVPQGASRVETTVRWTPKADDLYADVRLWVRTAEDNEAKLVGPLKQGETLDVASTNRRNDLPHQELSAWVFEVRMSPPSGYPFMRFNGEVHVEAYAIRGLEIPVFPGHPDPWKNRTEITLFNSKGGSDLWLQDDNLCLGACLGHSHKPEPGAVVPLDHARVEAQLTVVSDLPNTLHLVYHAANSRAFISAGKPTEAGNVRTYTITGARGDGAYALGTLWDFGVVVERAPEQAFRGDYELRVVVHRGDPATPANP